MKRNWENKKKKKGGGGGICFVWNLAF